MDFTLYCYFRIIGEYAERMDNADELLERFVDNFTEENTEVQVVKNIFS